MYLRKKKSNLTKKTAVQIVTGGRVDGKVRQSIVQHVGSSANPDEIAQLWHVAKQIKGRLEKEQSGDKPRFAQAIVGRGHDEDFEDVSIKMLREVGRYHAGIVDVFGKLYDDLGFDSLFRGRHAARHRLILKACVLARLANPSSKLKTTRQLERKFNTRLHVDSIYRMMDQLNSERVKSAVCAATVGLLRGKVNVMLFDVTTLHFESVLEDELRSFGFSKDCKFKETQIVLALITTTDGLPITYEAFPGKTHEMQTLLPVIEKLRKEYDVAEVEFAADRGMFCEQNLKLLEESGIKYVVGAKLRSMDKATKATILAIHKQQKKGENKYQEMEIAYKGRRLIVCHNPVRAAKDRKDRQRLLNNLHKISNTDGEVAVKNLVKNRGSKKYLRFDAQQKLAQIDDDKIELDVAWDGISGYITNSNKPASKIIESYQRLWVIEDSFRISKHDLKMRPIFHRKGNRIKAHLDICFIAYALVRQLMCRYKIQKGGSVSFESLHEALFESEFSLHAHVKNKELYAMPSSLSPLAKSLYRIVGLKPPTEPYRVR